MSIFDAFGTPGIALQLATRRTVSGIAGLMGLDSPTAGVLDRPIGGPGAPGPGSPLSIPGHPYMASAMGLRLDERARAKLDGIIRIAPRVTLSVPEQERTRSVRSVMVRVRTPPRAYDRFAYNAAPLGGGAAVAYPATSAAQAAFAAASRAGQGLPCVDCQQ